MANTSPGYGITIRVEGRPEFQPVAEITTIITREGAMITALDEKLNEHGYIVPGLGDAGDRLYGVV